MSAENPIPANATPAVMRAWVEDFAGPFYADFSGLAPTLVHVGTRERPRDDSVTVVERMQAAGVAADPRIFDGMCHDWQLYAPVLDEGMASIEQYTAFITAHRT